MRSVAVLLVEDNDGDAEYIERSLKRAEETRFAVQRVSWLNTALTALGNQAFDCILLDLSLPDCQGVDTVVRVMEAVSHLPIIVMTGHDDMATGVNAVRYGAQDYLIKGEVQDRVLERAVVYAIERKRSDLVGKRLMRESISRVTMTGIAPAESMVRNHIGKVADFVHDLRTYLVRNAPAHLASIDSLAAKHDIDVALREAHTIVQLDPAGRPSRARRISDMATEAVESISRTAPPVEPASAKDTLLSVIEGASRLGAAYSGDGDG